jgi:signal peptidase II
MGKVTSKHRRALFLFAIFILVLATDQFTKLWAVENLADRPNRWYLGVLMLTCVGNQGAWGSLGANWSEEARFVALILIPAILLLVLAVHTLREKNVGWMQAAGVTIVVAGGLGNLIDRYRLGYVIDFLYLGYGPIGTNIFNVADMAVLLGVGLLLTGVWRQDKGAEESQG